MALAEAGSYFLGNGSTGWYFALWGLLGAIATEGLHFWRYHRELAGKMPEDFWKPGRIA